MTQDVTITEKIKDKLYTYITENSNVELINAYLYFIQNKFNLQPVLYPKSKVIFMSADEAMTKIQSEQEIWREAEIKITFSHESVNSDTKKIYICPFSGKVFGDNTHPNPQDAIYDWVSKCPENTERSGGLRVKRFFVSDDQEVIKSYLEKNKPKEPIKKKVYSSAMSGKIFSSKESVIRDFRENYLRPMTLLEVQNQNKFSIEEGFLEFIQAQLVEDKVAAFIEALAGYDEFLPFVQKWLS
ncbi:MAG: DUF2709 domain-containing protein [Chlamydiota bacterium]|nr:DUF2709 domain-containing protein [Chlamydiota bacterium]